MVKTEEAHMFSPSCALFSLRLCRLFFCRSFCLRAGACGYWILQIHYFFRLRGWRTRGPSGRALLSITRPQRTRREDPPHLWTPPFSAMCVPRRFGIFAQWDLVQRRMEQVPSRLSLVDLQGAISNLSGSFSIMARSTPKVLFVRVSPFDFVKMKVLRERVRLGSYIFALHLH